MAGSQTFDELLQSLRSAHADIVHGLEAHKDAVEAENAQLRQAMQMRMPPLDLLEKPREVKVLRPEPLHSAAGEPNGESTSPKSNPPMEVKSPIHPWRSASPRGSGERRLSLGPLTKLQWTGLRKAGQKTPEPRRVLAPPVGNPERVPVRDPQRVTASSDRLLSAIRKAKLTAPLRFLKKIPRLNRLSSWRIFIQSFWFDLLCAIIIVLNAITVGIEVNILARHRELPPGLHIMDLVIVTWFTFEFVARLWAEQCQDSVVWTAFDLCILIVCFVDLTLDLQTMPRNYSMVRFLRFVRVLRVLKVVKIGQTVNNYFLVFSKMTYCLRQSMPSLLSAATVIVAFTYIASIMLTQASTDHLELPEVDLPPLSEHYGSLDRTFYTLVKSIFNGQAWGELMQPLTYVSWIATTIYISYLMLTLLCFLNVIHGVFVDSALQSTAHYKELMIAEAQQKRLMLIQHLQEVFKEIDTDGSGSITVEEFDSCLSTPGGRAFFEVMGLSTVQAYDLFRLIDADASSTVDINEFCEGCMRFMGEAKNFDIQCIIAENRQVLHKWNNFIEEFDTCMESVVGGIQRLGAQLQSGGRFQATASSFHFSEIGSERQDDLAEKEQNSDKVGKLQKGETVNKPQTEKIDEPHVGIKEVPKSSLARPAIHSEQGAVPLHRSIPIELGRQRRRECL